jgi:probable rRNA maturation factor
MFSYNILWNRKIKIDKNIVDNIFDIISNSIEKKQNWVLNIVFLDDNSIQNLNKKYRNIDSITDVLSFHYFVDFSLLGKKEVAWEIVLSENKIISQWKKYGLWSEKEFYKLLIHSILHILWYDHENENDYKAMKKLEKKIMEKVFL